MYPCCVGQLGVYDAKVKVALEITPATAVTDTNFHAWYSHPHEGPQRKMAKKLL